MMSKKISVIETEYKGYKFRSRLEARWAIFFDAMGVNWSYEPEGFRLDDGSLYLPDFYLPDLDICVEVKGIYTIRDQDRVYLFENGDKITGQIIVVGDIPPEVDDVVEWAYDRYKKGEVFNSGMNDFPYLPCVCPTCGKFGFQFDGRGARICRHDSDDKGYTANDPRIMAAYAAARQARFEHGETPKVVEIKDGDINAENNEM